MGNTWVCKNLGNMATNYVHQCLDLPISTTIFSTIQTHRHFGQVFQLPSIKFLKCQTAIRSTLKSSDDEVITKLWKSTIYGRNIQHYTY